LRNGQNKLRTEKGKEFTKNKPARKKLRTLTPTKPRSQKDIRELYKSRRTDHPVEEDENDRTVEEEKIDHTVQKNVCNDSEHEDEILTKQDENNIDEKSEHFVRNDHHVAENSKLLQFGARPQELGQLCSAPRFLGMEL
jgi:hypothetical protein